MKPSGSSPSYALEGSWIDQFGVTRQKLSHRSRQLWPIRPRSRMTWSIPALVSLQLVARPACPAPTIATGTCSTRSRGVVFPRIRRLGDLLHVHPFFLDHRILMAGDEQEARRLPPHAFVLAHRDAEPFGAGHVAALAEDVELPGDRAEGLIDLFDAF